MRVLEPFLKELARVKFVRNTDTLTVVFRKDFYYSLGEDREFWVHFETDSHGISRVDGVVFTIVVEQEQDYRIIVR